MWFRNDLRLLDNEALLRAWAASECLLPVYCLDPRHFGTTHYFGFPKTGAIKAQFLIECLEDLKKNMMKRGQNLLVQYGKPESILPQIVKTLSAHTVYAQKETCSEELLVERLVRKGLQEVVLPQGGSSNQRGAVSPKLVLVWGSTMYHIDDLPFTANNLPDVYTQFRKAVESKSTVRNCFKLPPSLGPLPEDCLLDRIGGWGTIPTLEQLGLKEIKVILMDMRSFNPSPGAIPDIVFLPKMQCEQGMCFHGGENAALGRIFEYFWKKDQLKVYKETRNAMLGPDYSTKFSPWLASGSISPRYIHEEVRRYEKQRLANESTYW